MDVLETPQALDGLPRRIAQLLDLFPTRRMAATVAGISTDQLTRYAQGRSSPPFEVLARLARDRAVSLDWLASGSGEMRLDRRLAEADPGLALLGLLPSEEPGWYRPRILAPRLPAPTGVPTAPVAVMAADDALAPEGVRSGFICYGSVGGELVEGDLLFAERSDGLCALRRFEGVVGGVLRLARYDPADPRRLPMVEAVGEERIARLAPILKIRRKL